MIVAAMAARALVVVQGVLIAALALVVAAPFELTLARAPAPVAIPVAAKLLLLPEAVVVACLTARIHRCILRDAC